MLTSPATLYKRLRGWQLDKYDAVLKLRSFRETRSWPDCYAYGLTQGLSVANKLALLRNSAKEMVDLPTYSDEILTHL